MSEKTKSTLYFTSFIIAALTYYAIEQSDKIAPVNDIVEADIEYVSAETN